MTTKLNVRNTDAALVFRRDGLIEKLIPREPVPGENTFVTEALFWASMNPAMMKTITRAFLDSIGCKPDVH